MPTNRTVLNTLLNTLREGYFIPTGDEIKINALRLPTISQTVPPTLPQTSSCSCPCPFKMIAFGDINNQTNDLQNDKSDFIFYENAIAYSNIKLILQKGNCGTWTDVYTFIDDTYGEFCAWGKNPNFDGTDYVDDFGKKYTGLFLDWLSILLNPLFGPGEYRIKAIYTDVYNNSVNVYDNREFCLYEYLPYLANKTIRFDTIITGIRGNKLDFNNIVDYSTAWSGQLRIYGMFYEIDSDYNEEFNQYGDEELNAYKPIISEQHSKYTVEYKPIPAWLRSYISVNILQADNILCTDYNVLNDADYIKIPVKNQGGIKSLQEKYTFPKTLMPGEISLGLGLNNLRRRNS